MLTAVTLYYDAELDYNYQFKGMAGLGFAIYTVWYLLPQDPKLAFKMYMDVTNIYQTLLYLEKVLKSGRRKSDNLLKLKQKILLLDNIKNI